MKSFLKRLFSLLTFSCIAVLSPAQDRSLEYYLGEGLQNSPLLKDLVNQENSASVDSLIILAQRKPLIEWKSQLLYSPYNDHLGYDGVITDGGNYQAVGYISQNIFNRKIVENKFNAIENQKKSIDLSRKISTADLKRTITGLYLDAYSVYSDLVFNRSFLDLMNEQNQAVGQFVKAGIYSQSDYLALLVETEGQVIIVGRLRNQYGKNIRLLNEACGIVDTSYVTLKTPDIRQAGHTIPSVYLFQRQYSIDSLQIINDRASLNLRYKPAVSWFADAGILTSNPWNFYRHFGASAGISLNFPIYDGRQRRLEEQKLALREDTRTFYNTTARKQYDQQFLGLKSELEGLKDIRADLEKQLSVADQLVKSLRSQLETGIVRMTDYLTALKNYRSIRHSVNIADIEMLVIINEMNYILSE